eukprot:4540006-Alexandrium_andersonii.AAC.1
MSASLVGSEMCIRDRAQLCALPAVAPILFAIMRAQAAQLKKDLKATGAQRSCHVGILASQEER